MVGQNSQFMTMNIIRIRKFNNFGNNNGEQKTKNPY